jgi:predicted glutamine amidotransferase
MCTIAYAVNRSLTASELENTVDGNPDGTGFAWWDKNHWSIKKGLMTYQEVVEFYDTMKDKFPHIMHSRIATHGIVSRENTHPFPTVGKNCTDEDETQRCWLFHNGIWLSDKTEMCDSHLLAKLVSQVGHKFLQQVASTNRFIFISPNKRQPAMYGKWITEKNADGVVKFSNTTYTYGSWPDYNSPRKGKFGGHYSYDEWDMHIARYEDQNYKPKQSTTYDKIYSEVCELFGCPIEGVVNIFENIACCSVCYKQEIMDYLEVSKSLHQEVINAGLEE